MIFLATSSGLGRSHLNYDDIAIPFTMTMPPGAITSPNMTDDECAAF